jgi:hypothetical protein
MGHGLLAYNHDLFSFFLCGFYEKRCRLCGHAKPMNTDHFPEEIVVFYELSCDPQRRLGSSFNASSLAQNIHQSWTPACAGDHGEGGAQLGDICAKYLLHVREVMSAKRVWIAPQLSEELAIFDVHSTLRVPAPSREPKTADTASCLYFLSSHGDAKMRKDV